MKSTEFCYWLQGFMELSPATIINETQKKIIKNHLNLVFKHEIDSSYFDDPKVQKELNQIHQGKPFSFGEGHPGETMRC